MDLIESLCRIIDRLNTQFVGSTKIYIDNRYAIFLDDNTFTISSVDGNIIYENLNLRPFLQWINENISIDSIELDINFTQGHQEAISFYVKGIANPYNFIKSLTQVIDRLSPEGIETKVYITALGKEYAIFLDDNVFILTSIDGILLYENDNLLPFLKWIGNHIFDITLIKLDLNLTQNYKTPIVFYNCDKPGCYHSSKERIKATRVIQKYAIPRYNNPQRPEVRERLLREFRSMSFGQVDNSEPISLIRNIAADNIIVYFLNNNYFLNKNTDGGYHFIDDDETIDTNITLNDFIDIIKNKIIVAVDLDDENVWNLPYIDEKEEIGYQIKNRCLQEPMALIRDQVDCAICLEPLVNNKKICKPNSCTHYFHCNCWNKYKKKIKKDIVPCPICRKPSMVLRCITPFEFGKTNELKYLHSFK